MAIDIWIGALTIFMAVLGGIVSVHTPSRLRSRVAYGIAFMTLGVFSFVLIIQQSKENAKNYQSQQDALARLADAAKESQRLQQHNAELQTRLVESSTAIAFLARQGIDTTTGGDSFAYLEFLPPSSPRPLIVVLRQGKFPLRNIDIRLVDQDQFDSIAQSATAEQILNNGMRLSISAINPQAATFLGGYPLGAKQKHDFLIEFSALNGMWTEILRIRDGKQALRVSRYVQLKPNQPMQEQVIFERVDPDYPRVDGKVQWE
jgi:hypothetical protein